jgi:DNA adenine methylase
MKIMILRRLGNKSELSSSIIKHFPKHKYFVDVFFGAGGIFFNKPKSDYNILNDIDSDVTNLFLVVLNQKDELEKSFYEMPIHSDLVKYWYSKIEDEPIKKALRFLLLSNFTLLGTGTSVRHMVSFGAGGVKDFKNKFKEKLDITFSMLYGCNFTNFDFRKFLNSLSFSTDGRNDESKTFIYADPPYLGTTDNYSHSFIEQDSIDLFDCLQKTKCKFAISEFDNTFILEQAKQRNLNVIQIGERQNIKNRRTEILVTNYETEKSLFD